MSVEKHHDQKAPFVVSRVAAAKGVALESTIIAHGLPRPRNLEVARNCERNVAAAGATPATIGIVPHHGAIVGLNDMELENFANRDGVVKTNLSNLAAVLARDEWGATSVSTSLWAAHHAGLAVFVTGGIGGVHRGFARTFDISADLTALERFPVATICSGVKSLLDVGATREQLETRGVPVIGYRCDSLPMFYVRESGFRVDVRCESPEEIAEVLAVHFATSRTGVVIGNPIPESHQFSICEMEEILELAEAHVAKSGIPAGRDVTPRLLAALHELSQGRTLDANAALIESNATLGGEVAVALDALLGGDDEELP